MRIPPDRHPEVLSRAGKGESSEQIAAWLGTVGVEVSDRAVRRLLAKTREFRGDAIKADVRAKLSPTNDIDELDATFRRARKIEDSTKDPELKLRAMKLQSEILDKKLHYSGADSPDSAATATVGVLILPPVADD